MLGVLLLSVLNFQCCRVLDTDTPVQKEPVTVGIIAGGETTRTAVGSNGLSTSWTSGDQISVWAKNSAGAYTLENKKFNLYGLNAARGFFTATLDAAMPEDTYTYYACHPYPNTVSGETATFTVPATQDGSLNHAEIMVAYPETHSALTAIPDPDDHSGMQLRMVHKLHNLRFYLPEGEDSFSGEPIEKIVVTMPRDVVGRISTDISDPQAGMSVSSGSGVVTMELAKPIHVSTDLAREYACAGIIPQVFEEGETMGVKVYTASHWGTLDPVALGGRTFAAGHSSAVRIIPTTVGEYAKIRVNITDNHLGEGLQSVTLTAPSGCSWAGGSNVYTYNPGHLFFGGESFEFEFEEIAQYRAFSGRSITVTFDSEHVTTSQTFVMPTMTSGYSATINVAAPYLLYEDFSGVGTFSHDDQYGTLVTGSKSSHGFLNGWTGARIGAEAGKCIRIACRRETSARYPARVDSAPIIALKKPADISVKFDYGMNNQYGGISLISNADVGQDVYIGYVTSTSGYSSGDSDGHFEDANTFYIKDHSASYDSTPNEGEYIIHNAPTGTVRITWRTQCEANAGTTNTTCWLYIDNVKVQIAN